MNDIERKIDEKGLKFPIETAELEKLVPHKDKMFLISRVLECNPEKRQVTVQAKIKSDNIFLEDEGVPNWVGFELMAQSLSAMTGISNFINDEPVKIGMILSVSDFVASVDFYKEGETVTIRSEEDFHDEETEVYCCVCKIFIDEKEVSSAKITAIEVENAKKFLEMVGVKSNAN